MTFTSKIFVSHLKCRGTKEHTTYLGMTHTTTSHASGKKHALTIGRYFIRQFIRKSIRKVRKIGGSILMHYIFGGGNDSHCLPEILNEEKFDSLPHVRDLI